MKKRADSYFGLHFDFHASPAGCPEPIGEHLTEEDIREICTLLHPDFLQIDCKGHPGWASYPTKVGNAMPQFKGDPLALWRKVTAEEGVALYLHYSGVFDYQYCAEHPEEAVMNADGQRSAQAARTAGPYVDQVLIPNMLELALNYQADGAWIDGDCWGTALDYDPRTIALFEEKTGVSLNGNPPKKPGDPFWREFREFCRELFRAYVRHYTDAVHEKAPDFQICSNWAYTDHMPEEVSANVDFISGDLNPMNSFNSARYAARAIASQNRTWDLMSWNFRSGRGIYCPKHPTQLLQEAAAVISLGGGFQNYITQYRDGSPRMEQIRGMKKLEEFMRPREAYCFRGKPVHQAALLLSTFDRHEESDGLFSRNGCEKIMGLTALLCDCGHSLEIAGEHTLSGRLAEYPVIVIPELYSGLATEFAAELLDYVKNGGSLFVSGVRAAEFFAEAGAPYSLGEKRDGNPLFTMDGQLFGAALKPADLILPENAEILALIGEPKGEKKPLAAVIPFGKGRIAVCGTDLGTAYANDGQFLQKKLANAALDRLYTPAVKLVKAEGTVEVTLTEKGGKRFVQLVNAGGAHRDLSMFTEDEIQPCRDVTLSIACAEKPERLTLYPEGKALPFEWADGRASVTVDRVELHEIIGIDG